MEFDDSNNLIIKKENNKIHYIPFKFIKMIYINLINGKEYWKASAVYEITREQAAFILTNFGKKYETIS